MKIKNLEINLRLPLSFFIDGKQWRFKKLFSYYFNYKNGELNIKPDWIFNYEYGQIYLNEYDNWKNIYFPVKGLKDKIVLDIGAGCGESAKFFLDQGAKKVIAVEPFELAFNYLYINSLKHKIETLKSKFKPEMLLEIEHDFCKIDIEGYEALLFDNEVLKNYSKPISIEAHHIYSRDKLIELGFKQASVEPVDYQLRGGAVIMHRDFEK